MVMTCAHMIVPSSGRTPAGRWTLNGYRDPAISPPRLLCTEQRVRILLKVIAACGAVALVGAIVMLATGMITPGIVALAGTVLLFIGLRMARRAVGDGHFANPS
jgi:hypothetical protein